MSASSKYSDLIPELPQTQLGKWHLSVCYHFRHSFSSQMTVQTVKVALTSLQLVHSHSHRQRIHPLAPQGVTRLISWWASWLTNPRGLFWSGIVNYKFPQAFLTARVQHYSLTCCNQYTVSPLSMHFPCHWGSSLGMHHPVKKKNLGYSFAPSKAGG